MHEPADMSLWTGRVDEDEGGRGLRWHQRVLPLSEGEEPGVVLLGVEVDEGVRRNQGRPGAAQGPDRIRRTLADLPWHLSRLLYDGGNISCEDGDLESMQKEQALLVEKLLSEGHFPLLLGGGHEIALGSFLGLSRRLENGASVGVLNFDAHFDLRRGAASTSGTPFLQMAEHCREKQIPFRLFTLGVSETANTAALFDRADSIGVRYLKDEELVPWNLHRAEEALREFLAGCDALHLSIDLDVLSAASAPGVSAPASRGISLEVLERLLDIVRVEAGERLRLAEIAEYNSEFDPDGRTAAVAARLCHLLTREVCPPKKEGGK